MLSMRSNCFSKLLTILFPSKKKTGSCSSSFKRSSDISTLPNKHEEESDETIFARINYPEERISIKIEVPGEIDFAHLFCAIKKLNTYVSIEHNGVSLFVFPDSSIMKFMMNVFNLDSNFIRFNQDVEYLNVKVKSKSGKRDIAEIAYSIESMTNTMHFYHDIDAQPIVLVFYSLSSGVGRHKAEILQNTQVLSKYRIEFAFIYHLTSEGYEIGGSYFHPRKNNLLPLEELLFSHFFNTICKIEPNIILLHSGEFYRQFKKEVENTVRRIIRKIPRIQFAVESLQFHKEIDLPINPDLETLVRTVFPQGGW